MPTTIAPQSEQIPVGQSIPALLPHAVSVSLPTWRDNVAYEEGEPWLVEKMTTGYPRFFVHKSIQQVSQCPISLISSGWNEEGGKPAQARRAVAGFCRASAALRPNDAFVALARTAPLFVRWVNRGRS